MSIPNTTTQNAIFSIVAIVSVTVVLSIASINDKKREQAYAVYNNCVQAEYGMSAHEWYAQYNEVPPCNVSTESNRELVSTESVEESKQYTLMRFEDGSSKYMTDEEVRAYYKQ